MTKTTTRLSQQDIALLEKAKKETRNNLIVWIVLAVLILLMSILVHFVQSSLDDSGTIVVIALIITFLPAYAIIRIYGFYQSINVSLNTNQKLIIEAETYTDFPLNSNKGSQFFKNDTTFYTLYRLDFKPFENSLFPMLNLPKSSIIRLEIAEPRGILLKYEMLSTAQIYKTEIGLLNETDRKTIISGILTFTKVMNFGIFPILGIVFGFAADWERNDATLILVVMFLIFFILGNGSNLIWYWITMRKFRNPNKIVLSGIITDKLVINGKYPKTYIYFGMEKIDVSNNYSDEVVQIGDTIAIHYFQKANKEKGSLIRVEKI